MIPLNIPYKKALLVVLVSLKGNDTIAPSGIFWIATPILNIKADPITANKSLPLVKLAKATPKVTPTDNPSGTLWIKTARNIFWSLVTLCVLMPSS